MRATQKSTPPGTIPLLQTGISYANSALTQKHHTLHPHTRTRHTSCGCELYMLLQKNQPRKLECAVSVCVRVWSVRQSDAIVDQQHTPGTTVSSARLAAHIAALCLQHKAHVPEGLGEAPAQQGRPRQSAMCWSRVPLNQSAMCCGR